MNRQKHQPTCRLCGDGGMVADPWGARGTMLPCLCTIAAPPCEGRMILPFCHPDDADVEIIDLMGDEPPPAA